jgi:hypothetical protein
MELRDLVVTPLYLSLIGIGAVIVKPYFTNEVTRRYFLPALWCKLLGALALGFIYQFYYNGGDTYNYHTYGSRVVWEAFIESPFDGLELLFAEAGYSQRSFSYSSRIIFITDPSSYFIVRVAALFDLLTLSTYSATSLLFSLFSFFGSWFLFIAFYELKPQLHRAIALAALFVPSVIFWGSGLLKDTITLGAIGLLTYSAKRIFIDRKASIKTILMLIVSIFLLFEVKRYILLCFLPALIIWIYMSNLSHIRSLSMRFVLFPVVVTFTILSAYFAALWIGSNDQKYSLDKIAQTARITAYDIRYYTGKDAGSGYDLGELDGTLFGMFKLVPQAINVSLFRPYLWEVKNPLMFLSALESFVFLSLTAFIVLILRGKLARGIADPNVIFCLSFSIVFAFAVGISTYNFGTLARYKIPLLPFYSMAIILMLDYWKRERKSPALADVE